MVRSGGRMWARCCAAAALAVSMCLVPWVGAQAEKEDTPKVVRVGVAQVRGYSETAPDGRRYGLIVDYLNEIAKYTGWEYEYIDTTGETMVSEFLQGRFDLIGGMYYSPDFEQYFAYPDYNCGYTKSVLLARRGDTRIKSRDPRDLNGKTIGIYANAKENIRRLEQFLLSSGVECTLHYYTADELGAEGIHEFLINGEVDLILGNNSENHDDCRVVASFDSQPHYIVTRREAQDLLEELSWALEKIADSSPDFAEERYEVNFPGYDLPDLVLDRGEIAYIAEKGTVTVALPRGFHPLSCPKKMDNHDGIVQDLLKKVSEFSGLEFEYIYTDSYAQALRLVQQEGADILGFFLDGEAAAVSSGLALTKEYVTLNNIMVRNKWTSYPGERLVGGIVEGRSRPDNISAEKICCFPDIESALIAVNRGDIDFVYGLSAHLEQEIQKNYLTNVVPVSLFNRTNAISFALPKPAPAELLTILNKAINQLSKQEKAEIADRNMISVGTGKYTLRDLFYANPGLTLEVALLVSAVFAVVVLVVARAWVRAAGMRSDLEAAEAESHARGAFLSRMSHEIRTPMNAVVGLADLTSMMDDVPAAVQTNLEKIRSSSHYLLSLINDILDMSRIDSGAMSIAKEPFSLRYMLEELKSMMEAEAQRRGIQLEFNIELRHGELTGDMVRLQQVLTNLLSNALKFTGKGGRVQLDVIQTGADEQGAAFEFAVSDNGVGIAPADQKRIFHAFEQAGGNGVRSQGTGLGLPISANIVHLMGGELKLQSEPGQGSRFYFSIKLPYGEQKERPEAPTSGGLLRGAHLLLAEDNELNAEIAVQLLEMQGAVVQLAENGIRAVECFREAQEGAVQAILMDIQMPQMNGLEAAQAIRALPRPDAAVVPIIAMTANSFQEDIDAAMEAGMDAFITKPLDVNRLYEVLHGVLQRGGTDLSGKNTCAGKT